MSHTVTIKASVTDKRALAAACQRLGLAAPVEGKHTLYERSVYEGMAVQLPNWNYPVVFNTETGNVAYDNFGGHWGDMAEYEKLMQAYAVARATQEASMQGYVTSEETLPDGSIRITVNVEN